MSQGPGERLLMPSTLSASSSPRTSSRHWLTPLSLGLRSGKTPTDAAPKLPALAAWTQRYLSSYLTCAPSPFHVWLSDELGSLHTRRGSRLNVLAPRGNAKSTWSTFAYPLYCACHDLEPYIVLTSDTGDQARKYLDAIRAEFESNHLLQRAYPHLAGSGPVWREDRIKLANGVVIEALGTGTKMRGRRNRSHRPSLIVVDDPQNTGHILSPLQRDRSWEWLVKDVCNAGSPATNIVVLGTALHRDSIVCRLQHTPGWASRVFKALVSPPERMDLWAEWESLLHDHYDPDREEKARAYYKERRDEMDAGAEVLWPEREPLYDLMTLRASIGLGSFASEKQNDPTNPEACEWPASYFDRPGFWFEEWPSGIVCKALALDPSKGSDSRQGDYWAYVRLGVDNSLVLYCEAELRKGPVEEMVSAGIEHVKQFKPDVFAVESNAFQDLLRIPFLAAAKAEQMLLPLLPVTNMTNKQVRIRRLGPDLAQGRIRFRARSPGTLLLVQQLRDFPLADHDDGGDSLEMARRALVDVYNGRRRGGRTTKAVIG